MKFRLHITYDYEVDRTDQPAQSVAEQTLRNLVTEQLSIDDFVEELGGRVSFAVEVLPD